MYIYMYIYIYIYILGEERQEEKSCRQTASKHACMYVQIRRH